MTGAHGMLKNIDGITSMGTLHRHAMHLIHTGSLKVDKLITHVIPSADAQQAYELLLNNKASAFGILLDWR